MTQKSILCIILALFLLSGCSTIQNKNRKSAAKKRTDIYMLPPGDHQLTMVFNENMQKFILRDDIFINVKDLKGKEKGSFAIDKHIFIESLEINGRSRELNEIFIYEPKDFGFSVRPFRLTQVKRDCRLYEFFYGEENLKADSLSLTIRYEINPIPGFAFCTISEGYFKLDGDYLWFPNALSDSVSINVEIKTPPAYHVKMSNKDLPFVMNSNYLKTSQAVIKDNFKPITIIGEKRR